MNIHAERKLFAGFDETGRQAKLVVPRLFDNTNSMLPSVGGCPESYFCVVGSPHSTTITSVNIIHTRNTKMAVG